MIVLHTVNHLMKEIPTFCFFSPKLNLGSQPDGLAAPFPSIYSATSAASTVECAPGSRTTAQFIITLLPALSGFLTTNQSFLLSPALCVVYLLLSSLFYSP